MSSRQSLHFATASGTERTLSYKATPRDESAAFRFMAYTTGRPRWARGIVKSVTYSSVLEGSESPLAPSGSSRSRRTLLPADTRMFWVRVGREADGWVSDTFSTTTSRSGSTSSSSSSFPSPNGQGPNQGGIRIDPGRFDRNGMPPGFPGPGIPPRPAPIPPGPGPGVYVGRNEPAIPADTRPPGRVPYNGPGAGG